MLMFFIGYAAGIVVGVVMMALLFISSDSDKRIEEAYSDYDPQYDKYLDRRAAPSSDVLPDRRKS